MKTNRNLPSRQSTVLLVPLMLLALTANVRSFAQTPATPAPDAAPAEPKKIAPLAPIAPKAPAAPDSTVELSPFQVTAEANGYFQSNTMSGTRLNSKIEDLGQSITVMTKEQMRDFAMLDVNDMFDYMASTEGTNSYSQFDTDRTGAVVDQVSLSPNTANRVRGIGSANIAFNNIATSGRVPIDTLWIDSLELSRGANANIFGLGNASGTVNQVPATANLTRDFSRAEMRGDSYGGWRGSLDVNRVLVPNKLAVRASYADQHTGFVRKPSGEDARRLSAQIKARPFKNTTLSVSWYGYRNASVRPNYTTPRDYYTDWVKAGEPGWNAVTGLVTFANGQTYGNGAVLGSTTPYTTAPAFVGNSASFTYAAAESRSIFQIGGAGQSPYWAMPRYTANPATPAGNNFSTTDPFAATATGLGLLTTGPADAYTATQQPLYNAVARPITSKSIYDWTKYNLSNGKAWDNDNTYMAQLDQIILNTPKQTLAAQATFLREDSKRLENLPMGAASVNSNIGQLQPDVNMVYLDGTPNPYFGHPYLRSSEPFLRNKPLLWDTYRAQAVYKLDFTQDKGLSKWLGTQQLLGYYEYKDQKNYTWTYRHTALGTNTGWEQKYAGTPLALQTVTNTDPKYLINGNAVVPGNYDRLNEQYYVGNSPGGAIQYAPSNFPAGVSLPYVWGPSAGAMIRDVSAVGFTPGQGGGLNNLNEVIKTTGGVLQSTFLDNKLVGTFGLRQDTVNDRNSPLATLTPDLRAYDFGPSSQWVGPWRIARGNTTNLSVVARPFRDFKSLQSLAHSDSGIGRFLGEAASSLSLTYNNADNFIAQGPAYDLFLNQLPNQTGTDKTIGAWMTLLNGKLSIRYDHFDTTQINLRNGDITTMAQRVLRYEGFVSTDAYNLRSQSTAWLNGLGTGGSASNAQIATAINMPLDQYNGLSAIAANNTYAAVMNAESKGHELEINYNPTPNWTVSASATKIIALNTAAGAAVDNFIAERMPVWTTIEDPRFTQTGYTINGVFTPYPNGPVTLPTGATGHLLWWNIANISGTVFNTVAGYSSTQSPAQNFAANVDAPMSVFRALIGRPRPEQREYSLKFNTRYNLAGITENRILKNTTVGGSLRWESEGSIGFYGLGYTQGEDLTLAANKILQLDPNRPIYTPAQTYVDLFLAYRTKFYHDKIGATFQLNVKNLQENGGRLQAVSAFFDGRGSTYRIVDPRQFILSAAFDL